MDDHEVRFSLHSGQQYATYQEVEALWMRAESLGFDSISLFDHLRPPLGGSAGPCFEATSLLSALGARTTRIRCRLMVASVPWRHPCLLATQATTIDHVCGGRLDLGLGAGSADLAHQQYGIPLPPIATRIEMLDEACSIIRRLWQEDAVDFDGRHFVLQGAYVSPKPVQARVPLIVGGGHPGVLRVVARHADIWNTLLSSEETYRRRCALVDDACRVAGRRPDQIRRSVTFRAVLAESERAAHDRANALAEHLSVDAAYWEEYLLFGTSERCVERLQPLLALGVREFVLGARPPIDWETVERFAEQVLPMVRASVAGRR